MRSTDTERKHSAEDERAVTPPAVGASPDRFKTEYVFAGDDTHAVDVFHSRTKWGRTLDRRASVRVRAFLQDPALNRIVARSRNEYPDATAFPLPEAQLGDMSLQDAIVRRRSMSDDANGPQSPIELQDVSAVLKYSCGIVDDRSYRGEPLFRSLRACPSAGALYPLEIYPVVMDVTGLTAGVYHYDVARHALSLLRAESTVERMPGFDLQPGFRSRASVVFVVTAVLLRTMAKYLDRGYRFAMNEAGAMTQNMHLSAVSLGLPGCVWGGFSDDDVADYIGVDQAREVVTLGFVLGKRGPAQMPRSSTADARGREAS